MYTSKERIEDLIDQSESARKAIKRAVESAKKWPIGSANRWAWLKQAAFWNRTAVCCARSAQWVREQSEVRA